MAYGYITISNKNANYSSTSEWSDKLNIELKSVFGDNTILDFDKIWNKLAEKHNLIYGANLKGWCNTTKQISVEWQGNIHDINLFFREFLTHYLTKKVFGYLTRHGWIISEPFISEQCRFILNIEDVINWDKVIKDLKDLPPVYDIHNERLADKNLSVEEYEESAKNVLFERTELYLENTKSDRSEEEQKELKNASYKVMQDWIDSEIPISSISWEDFFPEEHFDMNIVDRFADLVNVTPIPGRTFITRVKPGKFAPYHWDVFPAIDEYKNKGEIVRYVAFIHDPVAAHTLSFDKQTFWNPKKGDVYQWSHANDMHSAANSSLSSYYLFHMIGYK